MSIVMLTSVVHAVNIRCEYNYTDSNGIRWHYNLSALTAGGGDYEASDNGGFRYALNVCRPPLSVCRPAGQPAPVGTGTAIKYWGLTPSQCSTPPCTTACALLGWGALGSFATRFSLIDPAEPNEGIRLTHVSLLSANATPSLPFTAGPAPPVPRAVAELIAARPLGIAREVAALLGRPVTDALQFGDWVLDLVRDGKFRPPPRPHPKRGAPASTERWRG